MRWTIINNSCLRSLQHLHDLKVETSNFSTIVFNCFKTTCILKILSSSPCVFLNAANWLTNYNKRLIWMKVHCISGVATTRYRVAYANDRRRSWWLSSRVSCKVISDSQTYSNLSLYSNVYWSTWSTNSVRSTVNWIRCQNNSSTH